MSQLNSPLFLFHASKEYFENGTQYAFRYFKRIGLHPATPFDSLIHPKLCVPATNIAFSIELAIKGLLLKAGTNVRGHSLEELYLKLPTDIKERVAEHYDNHDNYSQLLNINLGIQQDNSPTYLTISAGTEEFLVWLLATHKNAFVHFRYLYDIPDEEQWDFMFREISNFTFSLLQSLVKI